MRTQRTKPESSGGSASSSSALSEQPPLFNEMSRVIEALSIASESDRSEHHIPQLIEQLNNIITRLEGEQCLTKAGAIPLFVRLLEKESTKIQISAARTLSYLAHQYPSTCRAIIELGAIPLAVKLLEKEDTAKIAAHLLNNLSYKDVTICRDIVDTGATPLIVGLLEVANAAEEAAALLSNMAREDPAICRDIVDAGAIPLLIKLLHEAQHARMQESSASALNNLAFNYPQGRLLIAEVGGIIPLLVVLLAEENVKVQTIATSLLNQLSHENPPICREIVDAGAIPLLIKLGAQGFAIGVLRNIAIYAEASRDEIVRAGGTLMLKHVTEAGKRAAEMLSILHDPKLHSSKRNGSANPSQLFHYGSGAASSSANVSTMAEDDNDKQASSQSSANP